MINAMGDLGKPTSNAPVQHLHPVDREQAIGQVTGQERDQPAQVCLVSPWPQGAQLLPRCLVDEQRLVRGAQDHGDMAPVFVERENEVLLVSFQQKGI